MHTEVTCLLRMLQSIIMETKEEARGSFYVCPPQSLVQWRTSPSSQAANCGKGIMSWNPTAPWGVPTTKMMMCKHSFLVSVPNKSKFSYHAEQFLTILMNLQSAWLNLRSWTWSLSLVRKLWWGTLSKAFQKFKHKMSIRSLLSIHLLIHTMNSKHDFPLQKPCLFFFSKARSSTKVVFLVITLFTSFPRTDIR